MQVRFTNDDIELLAQQPALVQTRRPHGRQKDSTVQNDNRSFTFTVMGLDPSIQSIWNLDIAEGRFLNDADNMQHGLYAVVASEATRQVVLRHACRRGDHSHQWRVVRGDRRWLLARMQEGDNDNNRVVYVPFNSMDVLKDNHYLDGIWMDSIGLDHDKMDQSRSATLSPWHTDSRRTISALSLYSTPRSNSPSSAS